MSYIKKNMKAAVFIDHSNIASPILEPNCNRSVRINWKKLIDLLLNGYKNVGVFIFMAVMDPIRPEKEKFMAYLEKIGYVILRVPLMERKNGTFEQKQLDILMLSIWYQKRKLMNSMSRL